MTAYEMRISGWSSDVCSSDLSGSLSGELGNFLAGETPIGFALGAEYRKYGASQVRSEEHTSELQSLMRISYAVFCLKKKKKHKIKYLYKLILMYTHQLKQQNHLLHYT